MSESLEQFPRYLMGSPETPFDGDTAQREDTGSESNTKPRWARVWLARSLDHSDALVAAYEASRLALAEKVCREHGLLADYEGFECGIGGREAGRLHGQGLVTNQLQEARALQGRE